MAIARAHMHRAFHAAARPVTAGRMAADSVTPIGAPGVRLRRHASLDRRPPADEFQYLAVLISIVLGLGLTQLLTNIGRLAQSRARVRHYWPATVWTVLLFFIPVQSWWAMYGVRDHQGWTFLKFVVVIATPTALYLMTALVLPDVDVRSTEPVDLRAHYFSQTRWFFGASSVVILSSSLRPLVLDGRIPLDLDRGIQLVFLAAGVGAMFVRHEWLHKLLVVGTAGLYAAYVTLLFARLR